MIDGYLTEINVTSPTGIRAIKRLGGPDLAVAIWDAIEAKVDEAITVLSRLGRPCGRRVEGGYTSDVRRPGSRGRTPLRAPRAAPPRRRASSAPSFSTRSPRCTSGIPGDAAAFRRAAVETLQAALAAGRDEARQALEDGGNGPRLRRGAERRDRRTLARRARNVRALAAPRPQSGEPLPTIVAVGGYGRGMLAPFSDIDLLFLLPDKPPPGVEKVVEALLYVLWDLKQKVGHATRTVDECLRQARADMTIRTTLLEARFIIGDKALFETLQKRFDKEIVAKTAPEFVAAKLAEREARVRKAGASRYLVEPNVKEGKGGLRDLNTLFWISKYVYRVRNAHELVAAGLFSPREFALFRRCEEFLWSVRCRLHFLAGRAEERLSFDVQRPIARQLGYSTRAGLIDVERFMKHYFLIAKDVGDLTAIVCAALEERHAKATPAFGRLVGRLRRRTRAIADAKDFKVDNDRVNVIRDDVFERDPVNLIRLFWIADRSNLPIHPDATRLVTQSLKRIDARLREDTEANRLFLEILTSRNAPGNRAPAHERGRRARPVHSRFRPRRRHDAILDVPSLHGRRASHSRGRRAQRDRGRAAARRICRSRPRSCPRSPIAPSSISRPSCTTSPRDAGSIIRMAGAEVARKLGPRLGLFAANTERVAWLVEQHLAMSNMAQGRDLFDPRTAEALSAIVQTQERLKMLLALTVADIRAVGPGRVERLEGPASAHALLGDRSRARRRPFGDRPQGARRGGAGGVAPLASRLVRSRIRRLRPASLSRLLAEGRACAPGRPRQIAARDGGRDPSRWRPR